MTSPAPAQPRRTLVQDSAHAIALRRQLAWAEDFTRAGDLASAIDALGDARALAQELGHLLEGSSVDWP